MTDERFHGEPVCTVQQLRTPLLLKNLEERGDLIPIALRRLAAHDRERIHSTVKRSTITSPAATR
mgnify:CR=1 FL=1